MTVRELLSRIDSAELTEWQAYETEYGPLGQERDDWLAANVAATVANVNRPPRQRAFKIGDFVPRWGGPKEQDPQAMLGVFRALAAMGRKPDDDRESARKARRRS